MSVINNRIAIAIGAGVLGMCTPLIAYYEGFVPQTYADPVGIPTICYGHTGPDVVPGRRATRAECEALLAGDLSIAYGGVMRCTAAPLKDWEIAALVSFTYNVGSPAFCKSTMARMINAGLPASAWCPELDRFVYAKGIKLSGLVKRRAAERQLCEKGPFFNVVSGGSSTAPEAIAA